MLAFYYCSNPLQIRKGKFAAQFHVAVKDRKSNGLSAPSAASRCDFTPPLAAEKLLKIHLQLFGKSLIS
jgi:hypothetical protein